MDSDLKSLYLDLQWGLFFFKKANPGSVVVDTLLIVAPIVGFCN